MNQTGSKSRECIPSLAITEDSGGIKMTWDEAYVLAKQCGRNVSLSYAPVRRICVANVFFNEVTVDPDE